MKRSQEINQVGDSNVYQLSDYVSPRIQDVKAGKGKDYMMWGHNNSFYDYLRDLYLNSTTNNAAINGIIKLAYGDGLKFEDPKKDIQLANVIPPVEMRRLMLQFEVYNKWVAQVEYHLDENGVRDMEKGVRKVFFLPAKEVAPCKKNEDGEITDFFVSKDWNNTRAKEYKPKQVPAFGFGTEEDEIEIYFWQLEIDNDEYFAPVGYQGCLQYAECEVETSNYHLNHILRGFAPAGIVNFNNGVGTPEMRKQVTRDFVDTKTGSSNAGKAFIMFNEGSENAATIASYDVPDPHKQYEFIGSTSEKKILLSHNISSPLLFGIRGTSGGLGSNANEIRESYGIMREMTLEPIRQAFIQGLEPLLLEIGIPQTPKFSDLSIFGSSDDAGEVDASYTGIQISSALEIISKIQTKELTQEQGKQLLISMLQIPAEVAEGIVQGDPNFVPPVKLSSQEEDEPEDYSKKWMKSLEEKGEMMGDDWQEVSSTAVDNPEAEDDVLSIMMNDTSPPDGKPQDASEGDSGLFKVRYRYGPQETKPNSRDLCVFLVGKSKQGMVYRKEDIDSWEDSSVNGQFAPEGKSKYSLWLWKGGVYCGHRWFRVIYFRKRNADGSFKKKSTSAAMDNDKKVSQPQARTQGIPENKLNAPGWPDAGTAPIDQPNRGSLKNK